ncbi:hypothetical protein ITJ44_15430 [Clavibacter sp. VKM Ac-2873]|uniref:hypothetical protein n=1 Tax=Clavibacter sp. VKM Ac-2873 TaxID=2783813 RepID=UPI00188D4C0B|nr:hypothetical protein [Clavibacter sp. VKM Ac-2873]MBF4619468.1 hypothetical protein [Clavibacter sp. VKM Ac-2873]
MTDPYLALAGSLRDVAGALDLAADPAWGSLTMLQRTLLSLLEHPEPVDRNALAARSHTARAAVVPSLRALVARDLVSELPYGAGSTVALTSPGWRLLTEVSLRRRDALEGAAVGRAPALSPHDARELTHVLERFLRSV